MVERGGEARFPYESVSEAHVLRQLRREDLQRHAPTQLTMLRAVDDSHAAATHELLDEVWAELRPDHRVSSDHSDLPPMRVVFISSLSALFTSPRPRTPQHRHTG